MYYDRFEFWRNLLIITSIIAVLNLFLTYYRKKIEEEIIENRMYNWLISKKDLVTISDDKFEKWCSFLLQRLGYENIKIISERYDGEKDIICSKDNEKIYVVCRRNSIKDHDFEGDGENTSQPLLKNFDGINLDSDDNYLAYGRPFIQKLVGLMKHDKIFKGIILTTGRFSAPAMEYVNTLPDNYQIKLIDGDDLTLKHWQLLKNRI